MKEHLENEKYNALIVAVTKNCVRESTSPEFEF